MVQGAERADPAGADHPGARVLVVMGVSGVGKTTIAKALAQRLQAVFADGDDFHPPANVAKMSTGTPLTDADRGPWLAAIAAWIDARRAAGERGVVACSALKRRYREVLVGARPDVAVVFLRGPKGLIAGRLSGRRNHFMPPGLLESQIATLEPPGDDERPIAVDASLPPKRIVDAVVARIGA
jgi:carbohydrate kinase (thermoresistant glucokinase family)